MTILSPYIYAWSRGSDQFKITTLSDVRKRHPELKSVTLAFLTSDRFDEIKSWKNDCQKNKDINVILSIGGALGSFPSTNKSIHDETEDVISLLKEMAIDKVDLDIEGTSLENVMQCNRWIEFAKSLQREYNSKHHGPLSINLTLPVEFCGGFGSEARTLIEEFKAAGVSINTYNCMIMCFNTKLKKGQKWGPKCISVMHEVFEYMQKLNAGCSDKQIWNKLGICPMIGMNDDHKTQIDLSSWQEILDFAFTNNLGLVSFWAINRDQRKSALKIGSCYQYSLSQTNDHEFTDLMLASYKEKLLK